MDDLLLWDFVAEFTTEQAALLIEGKSPNLCYSEEMGWHFSFPPNKNILERMKADYMKTYWAYVILDDSLRVLTLSENLLPSVRMNLFADSHFNVGINENFIKWLGNSESSNIDIQKFSRASIQHWINTNNFPTKYQFVKRRDTEITAPTVKDVLPDESLETRERTAYLNIIGVLLGQLTKGTANDTTVIAQALESHKTTYGISKRKLEEAFAAAKRSLKAS